MTLKEAMAALEAKGDEGMRKYNLKNGAGENQFGVKMGDIRTVAKAIKSDHELALQLWATGNLEARFLATLIIKPKQLTAEQLDKMVRDVEFGNLADWLNNYVVKQHPDKEALRLKWMSDSHPSIGRAAWSLTTERVSKSPEGLDFPGLLDRIESEMGSAPELTKWMMNFCLMDIGIYHATHRQRAIQIGEKLGAYKDWPVNKGCIPPYAPVAIRELAARQA